MKKMILAAILATVSAVSMAEGTNGHFTGFGVGAELGATDWSDGGRTVADVNAVGSYGFAFPGTELVGQADVKYNFGNGRVYSDNGVSIKARNTFSVGYAQGYRVTPNIMPYAKVSYVSTDLKASAGGLFGSSRVHGVGVGVGAKMAVDSNVELGAEYQHARLSNSDFDGHLKTNSFNVGAAIRF